jgi:molybdopterin molybdotransferase
MITPQMAEAAIDAQLAPLPAEARAIKECIGQTLRQDIYPERDNPPFDRVCMDGVAIQSRTVAGGLRRLRIEASQPAGTPALTLAGVERAIEVTTGAILPRGTDCIIPHEEYEITEGVVCLRPDVRAYAYRNVQRQGSDSPRDKPMLRAGTILRAPEIAVVASAGLARVAVSRQPRLMVISTGDELIEPGEPIATHQVRRSNAHAIVAALRLRGFESIGNDHLLDDERVMREKVAQHLSERDVLIVSGGVSKGKLDLVPPVLRALGVQQVFHEVAQRPGMPMWFGVGPAGQAVFGLPGNPVSTLVCLLRYVTPALARAMGSRAPSQEPIILASSAKAHHSLASFLPVALRHDESGPALAVPRPPNGPGDFLGLTRSDGFIELPPRRDPVPEGFAASLYRW